MTTFTNRYASAIQSGNLASDPDTTTSDTDVLGAAGLAGKEVRHVQGKDGAVHAIKGHPLAMSLLRLLMGDKSEARAIVHILAPMVCNRAEEMALKPRMRLVEAMDISRAVLGWCRDSVCKTCHGHGFKVAVGVMGSTRAVIGDSPCDDCHGSGKRPFEAIFAPGRRELALWLRDHVERELAMAAPCAMQALAPRLDL